jgi:hypothetical protein
MEIARITLRLENQRFFQRNNEISNDMKIWRDHDRELETISFFWNN